MLGCSILLFWNWSNKGWEIILISALSVQLNKRHCVIAPYLSFCSIYHPYFRNWEAIWEKNSDSFPTPCFVNYKISPGGKVLPTFSLCFLASGFGLNLKTCNHFTPKSLIFIPLIQIWANIDVKKKFLVNRKYPLPSQSEKHILFQAKIVKIYALLETETSENHNLWDRTHLYIPCQEIPFPSGY